MRSNKAETVAFRRLSNCNLDEIMMQLRIPIPALLYF